MKHKQKRDEFKLRVSGVSLGKHCFSICCDDEFFEIAEIQEKKSDGLQVDIVLEKKEKMLLLDCHFHGKVIAPCDRCLDLVSVPLDFSEQVVVQLVPEVEPEDTGDDEIWKVNENIYELDLFHFVYEAIVLALPARITHPYIDNDTPECNPEVIQKWQSLSSSTTKEDARWDKLKDIKLN
ncbi:MAG: YceD family protein [Bacteroidales bacterium]|nr:YceD family protein [Bacteroidales bacterium]